MEDSRIILNADQLEELIGTKELEEMELDDETEFIEDIYFDEDSKTFVNDGFKRNKLEETEPDNQEVI